MGTFRSILGNIFCHVKITSLRSVSGYGWRISELVHAAGRCTGGVALITVAPAQTSSADAQRWCKTWLVPVELERQQCKPLAPVTPHRCILPPLQTPGFTLSSRPLLRSHSGCLEHSEFKTISGDVGTSNASTAQRHCCSRAAAVWTRPTPPGGMLLPSVWAIHLPERR